MKESFDQPMFPPPGKTPREDTAAVMKFYKLPKAFPPEVLRKAAEVSKLSKPSKRLDLRSKFIFTCDPVTARDYDDALSLETDRKGNRILGVHIADVSHYVKPGSALDREAYRRSTSVYLCDRVVPMLPEWLCNGLCSLVPGEDRLAFSVFMTFDDRGEMVARSFAKSIIRSKARFTYEEVMAMIAGSEEGRAKSEEGREKRVAPFAGLLPKSLMERTGLISKRFSGIKVEGLCVNHVVNRSLAPVFTAETMKNRGKSLELKNCRVFADDGSTNLVGTARLVVQPAPALVWNGGMRKLDDLLPNFREVKGEGK